MAILSTTAIKDGGITIPTQMIAPWLDRVAEGSAVAKLSAALPMKFGEGEFFTFDFGEAEYVGEGQNKSSSEATPTVKKVKPFKFQKTFRFTEEVLWADEDYQLGVVQEILNSIQPSLSRALDFGVFHKINPATGEVVDAMVEGLTDAAAVSGEGVAAVDAADSAVLGAGHVPSDMALAPGFAGSFATARDRDGRKLYPGINLGADLGQFEGHRVATSRTVSDLGVNKGTSGISAFVGDFSAIRWGIQRAIPVEVIRYGDPDGNGDLKRNNQVAFRAEVVYGWGIADLEAFAKVTAATDAGSEG